MEQTFEARFLSARRAVIAARFQNLNDMQREGVLTTQGPLLLLAGAGSGKTTVLINRIANLIAFGEGSDSNEIPEYIAEEDVTYLEDYLKTRDPAMQQQAERLCALRPAAHAMLAKSVVVAPSRVVTVKVGKIGRHNAFLSVDGGRAFRLNTGDEIVVKSSQKVTRLVRLKDTSFFEILNRKFIEKMR